MKPKKYIKNLEKYANLWVALDQNQTQVLASGKKFQDVEKKVSKKSKVSKVVFMRVPPLDASYAP